ncbi:MAG: BON domain-containing protein [Immundisolibacter sp.]|uniref:BON domain-containing protein n=1 Tax=Immundisolibacter sp. TaxID=1934948 RepID=UPI003EDF002B
MKAPIPKSLLVSSVALALAAISGSVTADTVSQDLTEARQETQIWTTYALSPYLRSLDLKVSVDNGKATLTGTVEEGVNKDLAKQIALGVSGIKEVDNQIVVQADYVPPARASSSERGFGEVVDDATITATVKSKLLWSKHTEGLDTDVDTRRGKVTLKGTATSAAAKDLAGRLAANTRGVASVDNRLTVKGEKARTVDAAKSSAGEAGHDIADAWITTKVKSTFMFSSNVDGSDISVDTKGGIVTLGGRVDSGAERALAIEFAQNVRGVKGVQAQGLTL